MEGFHHEPIFAEDANPVSMTWMKLDPAAGPLHSGHPLLRPQQAIHCVSPVFRHAHCRLDAVGQEYESSAWPEESRRLRDPAFRVAPYARPVLADGQIEGVIRERNVFGVGLDQREGQTEVLLAPAGGVQLCACQVHADRSGTEPGEPCGDVRRAATELDYVQLGDIPQRAQLPLRVAKEPPNKVLCGPSLVGTGIGELRVDDGPESTVDRKV